MKTEKHHCEYPAGAASERFIAMLADGWKGTGREFHEISRALGCAWPVAVLKMRRGGERLTLRFVGKPNYNIAGFSH